MTFVVEGHIASKVGASLVGQWFRGICVLECYMLHLTILEENMVSWGRDGIFSA